MASIGSPNRRRIAHRNKGAVISKEALKGIANNHRPAEIPPHDLILARSVRDRDSMNSSWMNLFLCLLIYLAILFLSRRVPYRQFLHVRGIVLEVAPPSSAIGIFPKFEWIGK